MNGLGLSPEALAQRRNFIQGSDAAAIVSGQWRDLWREKKGLTEPADLSRELRVQLGSYTEPFNLAWMRQETGRDVYYFSDNALMRSVWLHLTNGDGKASGDEHRKHPAIPYLAANLDALSTSKTGAPMYVDAKWLSRSDEKAILNYTPQMTHCALVCGVEWWGLSIIAGGKWELIEQQLDPFFAEEYLQLCAAFWKYVEDDIEPGQEVEGLVAIEMPKPQPTLRIVQLDDQFRDAWGAFNWAPEAIKEIRSFAETEQAHKAHMASRDHLKALVPEDVGKLTRGRFTYSRSKVGAVTMTMKEEKADDV
jgi:hypothetical protein